MLSLSDEEVMKQVRQGNPDALLILFDRFYRLVLKVALRILRDPGEAEDLMQDVFLEIFDKADQFDAAKGSAKTWILQYAYHRSLNRRQYLAPEEFLLPARDYGTANLRIQFAGCLVARFDVSGMAADP
jgi:RNA polymerase sigma-70 factor (ECF subfamily)